VLDILVCTKNIYCFQSNPFTSECFISYVHLIMRPCIFIDPPPRMQISMLLRNNSFLIIAERGALVPVGDGITSLCDQPRLMMRVKRGPLVPGEQTGTEGGHLSRLVILTGTIVGHAWVKKKDLKIPRRPSHMLTSHALFHAKHTRARVRGFELMTSSLVRTSSPSHIHSTSDWVVDAVIGTLWRPFSPCW
jgi:hypothetical protein